VDFCIEAPKPVPYHGFQAIHQFGDPSNTKGQSVDFDVGIYATAILLWVIAYRILFSSRARNIKGISWVRWYLVWYTASTGVFALILSVFNAGKILLTAAALHNLFEWGLIGYLLFKEKIARQWFRGSVLWIWFIITVVAAIPQVVPAFLFEQTFGLICDYLLLCIFFYCHFNRPEKDLKNIWKYGVVAAISHFGQIWTLIIGAFNLPIPHISQVLQWTLIFSPMITFWAYYYVGILWDEYTYGTYTPDRAPASSNKSVPSPSPARQLMPTWQIVVMFIGCGLWSASTIFGPPVLLGCDHADVSSYINGTTYLDSARLLLSLE